MTDGAVPDEKTERIYALCKWLRNVEADPVDCRRCPARVSTSYGPGVPGCYALAEEGYEIAHYGCRQKKGAQLVVEP